MLQTTATQDGGDWVIRGRKKFITGAEGAQVGIVMARTGDGEHAQATMFLVDLPHPAVRIERVIDTIDSSMPGGHAQILLDDLRVP
ncbi:acyl-CoA dehydrogenase family protein, partial [Salmonella enterica]|nr:acyl-CoA dehydrogenase family protein [Salmonella enterica]